MSSCVNAYPPDVVEATSLAASASSMASSTTSGFQFLDRFENPQIEHPPHHRGHAEHLGCVFTQPFQTPPDDESHALGNFELGDRHLLDPLTLIVEELSLFGKVLEHFLDEERIAFRLFVNHAHERRRWRASAKSRKKLSRRFFGKATQRNSMAEPLADDLRQNFLERLPDVQLDISIRADEENRKIVQLLQQMLKQQQRRLIGPVQIIQQPDDGSFLTEPFQETTNAVEEISLLLLGRQVDGLTDVVVLAT